MNGYIFTKHTPNNNKKFILILKYLIKNHKIFYVNYNKLTIKLI